MLKTISSEALYKKTLEPQPHIVHTFVTTGLNILAGAPKSGKSFLSLKLAYFVAMGFPLFGANVDQGEVLYMALEDTLYRLKTRMKGLGFNATPNLHFAISAPTLKAGSLQGIHDWLHRNKGKLVIIDTLARVRDPQSKDVYLEDSALGASLQQVAFEAKAAILVVHHISKMRKGDFLQSLSGSLGLPGAADVVMVLDKKRNETEAVLHVTGRDVGERQVKLSWNKHDYGWSHEYS